MAINAELHGVVLVDKPSGPTSHDIVLEMRRLFRTKAGHTGTLDPMATGVLPVVLGKATRLSSYLRDHDKEYLATIRLGVCTDTYDREGTILSVAPVPPLSTTRVEQSLETFRGKLRQQPPMFSAVKIHGEPLYKAARRGEERARQWREVTVFKLILEERSDTALTLRIHCSAGTYIRVLAHDLGEKLGCGAHLEALRRTRVGRFDLQRAALPRELREGAWERAFFPMEEMLPELSRLEVSEEQARRILHGNRIPAFTPGDTGTVRLFHQGRLLALARLQGSELQPFAVLGDPD
jgi:tRNA pseudouridine55 synthase